MQKKLSKQNNSGFTLSEVLIAVAILIVLMGLAMIPITRHQRDLRQTELDAKAEIVYHAAQNKLSELLANGRISDCYAEDLQPLNNTPLDAAEKNLPALCDLRRQDRRRLRRRGHPAEGSGGPPAVGQPLGD